MFNFFKMLIFSKRTTLIDTTNAFLSKYTDPQAKQALVQFLSDLQKESQLLVEAVKVASQFLSTDREVLSQIGTTDDKGLNFFFFL